MTLGIEVTNYKDKSWIPKPVVSLEEAPFPDWASEMLRARLWTEPTPIQVQGWPVAMKGYDLIGIASTGSGKTMAYVLPMLSHVMAQTELKPGEGPVGLVLLPTRELCAQVRDEIAIFEGNTGLSCLSVFGGENFHEQGSRFLDRVDIVTATPGRLISLLGEKKTNLLRVTFVVVDEADDLLDRNFKEQTTKVLSQVRPDRQVLLFSATFQDHVKEFAEQMAGENRWSRGTIQVNVGGIKLSACKTIDQQFWTPGTDTTLWPQGQPKTEALRTALNSIAGKLKDPNHKALVFCNAKETIDVVVEVVRSIGLCCEGFQGDLEHEERERILQRFKSIDTDLQLLVCTSVLGRGHDFTDVQYVINYDMPNRLPEYIHRIGRTGRRGQPGFSLTLLEYYDLRHAKDLAECLKETGKTLPDWLAEYSWSGKWKTIKREYHDLRSGNSGADGEAIGGPLSWSGRGKGVRHLYLRELNGAGTARGLPTSEL
mmetsp:Transcript_91961/g.265326  ORF Transcript_91961/g.265326 Transcript_91961/m.265326 type:complete len:484 (-) Transcript_91961:137-1588(-)